FKPTSKLFGEANPNDHVGLLELAHHSADQSRAQFRAQVGQIGRRAIGGKHELFSVARQRVDRMLQLDQGGALSGQELQVVDDQQFDTPILAAKAWQTTAAKRPDEQRRELLGRKKNRVE